MGIALRQMGRLAEAAQRLAQAAQRRPSSAEVWYELAQTQLALGEVAAARQSLQAALERDPQHAPSWVLHQTLGEAAPHVAASGRPQAVWERP
jgi:predicted Zn-dependent protease